MDIHRCKLCSRSFLNGRALGGHMKSHLSFLPHPPPPTTTTTLSSTASDDVPAIYSLRENPRKTIKLSDPDCESEAESRDRCNMTLRRKRRSRRIGRDNANSPEAEPVSSVSDTSSEEDVAMCLMMLCHDDGWQNRAKKVKENGPDSDEQKKVHQCEICNKCFRSSQALGGHRIIHRKKVVTVQKEKIVSTRNKRESFGSNLGLHRGCEDESRRIFECPFCGKVFGSGQALGGHKRSHLMVSPGKSSSSVGVIIDNGQNPTSTKNTDTNNNNNNNNSCIDLNLPAPTEDEDVYSVVSDDGGCNSN